MVSVRLAALIWPVTSGSGAATGMMPIFGRRKPERDLTQIIRLRVSASIACYAAVAGATTIRCSSGLPIAMSSTPPTSSPSCTRLAGTTSGSAVSFRRQSLEWRQTEVFRYMAFGRSSLRDGWWRSRVTSELCVSFLLIGAKRLRVFEGAEVSELAGGATISESRIKRMTRMTRNLTANLLVILPDSLRCGRLEDNEGYGRPILLWTATSGTGRNCG